MEHGWPICYRVIHRTYPFGKIVRYRHPVLRDKLIK
jgi:hypothetical protein